VEAYQLSLRGKASETSCLFDLLRTQQAAHSLSGMGKNSGLGIALAVVGAFCTASGYTLQKLSHRRAEEAAAALGLHNAHGSRVRSASSSSATEAPGEGDGSSANRKKERRDRSSSSLDRSSHDSQRSPAPHDLEALTEESNFGDNQGGDSVVTERRRGITAQPSPKTSIPSSSSSSNLSDPTGRAAADTVSPKSSASTAQASGSLPVASPNGSVAVSSAAPRSSRSSSSASSSATRTARSPLSARAHHHHNQHAGKSKPYFKFWQFPAGLGCLIVGSIIAVVCFGLAGQAELAPMSSVTLVFSELFAWKVLKEKFTKIDAVSVLLMSVGTTVALVFSKRSSTTISYDLQSILALLDRPVVWVFVSISAVIIAACIIISARLGKKKPSELSKFHQSVDAFCRAFVGGLLGGFTGFLVKSLVEVFFLALSTGAWGSFARFEFYLILVVMVAVLFNQVSYMNKGLARYDSSRIIPLYQSTLVFSGSLSGLLLWDELEWQTTLSLTLFGVGVFITIAGVAILSLKPAATVVVRPSLSAEGGVELAPIPSPTGIEGEEGEGAGPALDQGKMEAIDGIDEEEDEEEAKAEHQHLSAVSHTFETIEVLAGAVGGQALNPSITEDLELETGRSPSRDDDYDDGDGGDRDHDDDDEATLLTGPTANAPATVAPSPAFLKVLGAAAAAKLAKSPPPHLSVSRTGHENSNGRRRVAVSAHPMTASAAVASSHGAGVRSAKAPSAVANKAVVSAPAASSERHHFFTPHSSSSGGGGEERGLLLKEDRDAKEKR
jgi:uncharacterized membrane protein